jgi:hypothetical protein
MSAVTDHWNAAAEQAKDTDSYRANREDQLQRWQRDEWRRDVAADQNSSHQDAAIAETATPDAGEPAKYSSSADNDALSIECPQCHAAPHDRCYTYDRRSHCAPHHQRKADAAHRSPAARAAKHAAKEASRNRRAVVAKVRAITGAQREAAGSQATADHVPDARQAKLHAAIDALLAEYPSGDVIEATWDRAHARFRPNQQSQEHRTA